jgi:hypothetical protein
MLKPEEVLIKAGLFVYVNGIKITLDCPLKKRLRGVLKSSFRRVWQLRPIRPWSNFHGNPSPILISH